VFAEEALLLEAAQRGTKILSFATLNQYLGDEGLGVEQFEIAYTKRTSCLKYFLL
jgi:hypothetical protein